ncbi:MAG TPA: hypothetical protein VK888_01780 [Anaerolineales bacterium]|nr:hypothetical protein [Anaerolineales bacterium]
MATFDLNILPIHRVNGQEAPELPGLMALTPPRKAARGREHDTLIVYLMLSGNATLSAFELHDLIKTTAATFHQTAGSLTAAMRKAAENINSSLLERNLSTSGRGLQALGTLVLAVIRNEQCTLLLSGPAHAVWVSDGKSRHIHDPALSGKGLGSGQSIQSYFSQVELHTQDLLTLCGKFPKDWEADLLNERPPASLEASYRKLTMTQGDLNAALIQAHSGHGTITILRPEVGTIRPLRIQPAPAPSVETVSTPQTAAPHPIEPVEEQPVVSEEQVDALADFAAHMVQPSAYAIPPQSNSPLAPLNQEIASSPSRNFPSSIPRTRPVEPVAAPVATPEVVEEDEQDIVEEPVVIESRVPRRARSNAHAEATRQMAKVMVAGIRLWRGLTDRMGSSMQGFIPRLLPGSAPSQASSTAPTYIMVFIAVVIPILVVTIASVVYLRFGQSVQYTELYQQAFNYRAQATSETDPVLQRIAWENVLSTLEKAHT